MAPINDDGFSGLCLEEKRVGVANVVERYPRYTTCISFTLDPSFWKVITLCI